MFFLNSLNDATAQNVLVFAIVLGDFEGPDGKARSFCLGAFLFDAPYCVQNPTIHVFGQLLAYSFFVVRAPVCCVVDAIQKRIPDSANRRHVLVVYV